MDKPPPQREMKSVRFLHEQRKHTQARNYHRAIRMTLVMLCLSISVTVFMPQLGVPMIVFCLVAFPFIKRKQ